jgi:hypothetical protein
VASRRVTSTGSVNTALFLKHTILTGYATSVSCEATGSGLASFVGHHSNYDANTMEANGWQPDQVAITSLDPRFVSPTPANPLDGEELPATGGLATDRRGHGADRSRWRAGSAPDDARYRSRRHGRLLGQARCPGTPSLRAR